MAPARARRTLRCATSSISLLACSLTALTPSVLSAQASARAGAKVVVVSAPFRSLSLRQVLEIPESSIGAERITIVSAAPNGSIVVVDGKAPRVMVYSGAGAKAREIGRKGAGPGEFRDVSAIAWLHDTLVVLDLTLRRISLFSLETGGVLATFPGPDRAQGYLSDLHNAGTSVFAVLRKSEGPAVRTPFGGTRSAPPVFLFAPVSLRGLGPPLAELRDSTQPTPRGFDCSDKGDTIHILDAFFPNHGSLRAMGPAAQLINASEDSFELLIRPRDRTASTVLLKRPGMGIPVGNATWDSVAKEYNTLTRTHSGVRCDPPVRRPATVPVSRALVVDDSGRAWVETSSAGGGTMTGVWLDGTPVGSVKMPLRDERVPWYVRGGRLYVTVANADGLQWIRVYAIIR